MKKFGGTYSLLTILSFLITLQPVFSQVPDFSKVPSLHEGDSLHITNLIQNGIKLTRGKVIAWFPKDSLSVSQMNEIVGMINTGVEAAEKFIHAPLPWQLRSPNDDYTFYFRNDRFVSHASGVGFISIPFWRIKVGKSPWLHEVLHEMLLTKKGSWWSKEITDEYHDKNVPLWLFEGLPDYIALQVSLNEQLPWFDVFSNSSQSNIDSLFLLDMKSDKAKYTLSFIGRKGRMPELSTKDRVLFAPGFYHGSFSFVKYLVSRYGLKVLLEAISAVAHEHEIIEKLTGQPLEILRNEWLFSLKIGNE